MGKGYKPRPGVPQDVRDFAASLGRRGGGKATDLQRAAASKNVKKVTHPEKFTYNDKKYCILGILNPKKCLMPDDVARNPKKYHDKYFRVKWANPKGKIIKYPARFRYTDKVRHKLEIDEKGFIHVQNYAPRKRKEEE
jgi:hypothetical protein